MITTKILTEFDQSIQDFCATCAALGYKNNATRKLIKFDWCLETGGQWYGSYDGDRLIMLSGVHPFKDGYRALFRGARIPNTPQVPITRINKFQFQNPGMTYHIPLAIQHANNTPVYVTTNVSNDASGRMNKIHKSFAVMADGGMYDYCGDEEIFYTDQSIWKLNIDKYFELRKINVKPQFQ